MCLEFFFSVHFALVGWIGGVFSRPQYETSQLGGTRSCTLNLTLTLTRRASTTSATTTRPSRRPPWTNWRQRASRWRTTTSSPSARRHAASSSPAGTDITSCLADFLRTARFIPHVKNKAHLPWPSTGCPLAACCRGFVTWHATWNVSHRFISHVHLIKHRQKTFGKRRPSHIHT